MSYIDDMMASRGLVKNADGSWSPGGTTSPQPVPALPTQPNQPTNPMSPWVNSFNKNTGLQNNWSDMQAVGAKRADGKIKRKNGMWMTDEEMNTANGLDLGSGVLSSLGQTDSKFGMIS
jgi:hypothetical protein